eukprot:scaffold36528_cov374-Amphora_coffeaeformis.AAC.1
MAEDQAIDNKKQRHFITLNAKIDLCIKCEREVKAEKTISYLGFCRANQVDPSQLRRWRKDLVRLKRMADDSKASKKTCSAGRPSSLSDIADDILPWVHDLREQGVA